jgi:hypothetical protein
MECLQAFNLAIRSNFVDSLPLHISDPINSAFCIMTQAEFEEKSVQEVQSIMRRKHILITDMSTPTLEFDARGLASLTTLSTITDIQGSLILFILLLITLLIKLIRSIHGSKSSNNELQ